MVAIQDFRHFCQTPIIHFSKRKDRIQLYETDNLILLLQIEFHTISDKQEIQFQFWDSFNHSPNINGSFFFFLKKIVNPGKMSKWEWGKRWREVKITKAADLD